MVSGLSSRLSVLLALGLSLVGCRDAGASHEAPAPLVSAAAPAPAPAPPVDDELEACRARVRAIEALPDLGGAKAFEGARVELLGRARGEPMVFVREPRAATDEELAPALRASRQRFEQGKPGRRVHDLISRHRYDPEGLRALLLREGYLYSPDPLDALAMVTRLDLPMLFREQEIFLQRGVVVHRLERETRRRETRYRHADGPLAGLGAELLFGDRLALRAEDLAAPLHRDLIALAEREGFDRARVRRHAEAALLADLRFGDQWVSAVIDAKGAELSLGCVAEERGARERARAAVRAAAPRLAALAQIHAAVSEGVRDAFRFDRPEGEEGPDRDGALRPVWMSAYLQGRSSFAFEGTHYLVYDAAGRPWPPEVCVDFVLDSFERASGTWFRPRGEKPGRTRGRLDFNDMGIANRRGVIAFGDFAETAPELFDMLRFPERERTPFQYRSRFFTYLTEHADDVRPGDVIAIRGRKRDGRIHQHAILVERADPITGFPFGLADHMKKPRRRTWEGIMAEAPLRSLYYRARPRAAILDKIALNE